LQDEYKSFYGVNRDNAAELKQRISACGSFTTKKEVAHLLPPYQVGLLPLPTDIVVKPPPMTFDSWQAAQDELCVHTADKIPHIKEWAELALENGATHLAVMTYKRESAKEIASALLGLGPSVTWITGEMPPANRNIALAEAKNSPSSIIICTMDSVGIGIDLTFATQALFAELSYKWVTMDQALGRFSRLSGTQPSDVCLMVLPNSFEEKVARALKAKIDAINAASKATSTGEKAAEILGEARNEDALLESLKDALAS
jgi:superfamily II DNA/RNA helicase